MENLPVLMKSGRVPRASRAPTEIGGTPKTCSRCPAVPVDGRVDDPRKRKRRLTVQEALGRLAVALRKVAKRRDAGHLIRDLVYYGEQGEKGEDGFAFNFDQLGCELQYEMNDDYRAGIDRRLMEAKRDGAA